MGSITISEDLVTLLMISSNNRTAVFAFEGIGLVIPITESMKDPHQFPRVLTGVMMGIMVLFAGAGVLSYAAYGSAIQVRLYLVSFRGLIRYTDNILSLDGRLCQSTTIRSVRECFPTSLLTRHPPFNPSTIIPRRSNYGERSLLALGQILG